MAGLPKQMDAEVRPVFWYTILQERNAGMVSRGERPDRVQKIVQSIRDNESVIKNLSSSDPQEKEAAELALTRSVEAGLLTERILMMWIIVLAILGGVGLVGLFLLAFMADGSSGLPEGLLALISGITGGLVGLMGGRSV